MVATLVLNNRLIVLNRPNASATIEAVPRRTRGAYGGLFALVDQGIVSLTNFLTIVILAKLCSDSVFASFALAWQVVSYARTTQERVISAPYLAFVHRPNQDGPPLLGSSLGHELIFSMLSSVVLAIVACLLSFFPQSARVATGLFALSFALPWVLWRDHLRAISFANFRADLAIFLDLMAALIQLGGLGLLVVTARLELPWIAMILALSSLVPAVAWLVRRPFHVLFVRERLGADWKESWEYAKWLVLARSMGIAAYMIVPWVIAFKLGDVATGAFATCFNLVGLSLMFVSGLNNFLQPVSVRAYHRGGKVALLKSLWASAALFAVTLIPLCLVYLFFGSSLLTILYKESFGAYGMVVFIQGLGVLGVSFAIVASNGLAALERSQGNLWGEFGNFLVATLSAFPLIDAFGLNGAAAAISLGSLVASVVTLFSFMRTVNEVESTTVSEACT